MVASSTLGLLRLLAAVAAGWLVAWCSIATAQEPLEIQASGVSAVRGDVGQARDEALRDALRRAVEQVVGVVVEGRTLMIDLAVVEDRVEGRSEGFVRSYDVVDERRDGDLYRVEVRALVSRELVEDDLEGFGAILRTALGNPRVVVLPERGLPQRALEDITNYLVARSFFVVDPRQANADRGLPPASEVDALTTLARSLDVEVIVDVGVTSVSEVVRETERNTFHRGEATASLRAVLASTAQVAAAVSESAVVIETSAERAVDRAVRDATHAALDEFVLSVAQALNTSVNDEGTLASIRVSVTGLPGFDSYQAIVSALRTIRGVSDVQARRFENGEGSFDVQGTATAMELAFAVGSDTTLDLDVVAFDDRSIELRRR